MYLQNLTVYFIISLFLAEMTQNACHYMYVVDSKGRTGGATPPPDAHMHACMHAQ